MNVENSEWEKERKQYPPALARSIWANLQQFHRASHRVSRPVSHTIPADGDARNQEPELCKGHPCLSGDRFHSVLVSTSFSKREDGLLMDFLPFFALPIPHYFVLNTQKKFQYFMCNFLPLKSENSSFSTFGLLLSPSSRGFPFGKTAICLRKALSRPSFRKGDSRMLLKERPPER